MIERTNYKHVDKSKPQLVFLKKLICFRQPANNVRLVPVNLEDGSITNKKVVVQQKKNGVITWNMQPRYSSYSFLSQTNRLVA